MENHLALKIKLKHLAEEARVIKRQEQKMRGKNWGATSASLTNHRKHVVRPECRATHIAYGFLRGLDYNQIEGSRRGNDGYYYDNKLWERVATMVAKYGVGSDHYNVKGILEDWRKGIFLQNTKVA